MGTNNVNGYNYLQLHNEIILKEEISFIMLTFSVTLQDQHLDAMLITS